MPDDGSSDDQQAAAALATTVTRPRTVDANQVLREQYRVSIAVPRNYEPRRPVNPDIQDIPVERDDVLHWAQEDDECWRPVRISVSPEQVSDFITHVGGRLSQLRDFFGSAKQWYEYPNRRSWQDQLNALVAPEHLIIRSVRAHELLFSKLTTRQIAQYEQTGRITVRGSSGRLYHLYRGWARNVFELKGRREVKQFCCHPEGDLPPEDAMLAQKMWLETDEESFRKTANLTQRHIISDSQAKQLFEPCPGRAFKYRCRKCGQSGLRGGGTWEERHLSHTPCPDCGKLIASYTRYGAMAMANHRRKHKRERRAA